MAEHDELTPYFCNNNYCCYYCGKLHLNTHTKKIKMMIYFRELAKNISTGTLLLQPVSTLLLQLVVSFCKMLTDKKKTHLTQMRIQNHCCKCVPMVQTS